MDWLDKLSAKKGVIGIEVLSDGLAVAAKGCFGAEAELNIAEMLDDETDTDNAMTREAKLLAFVDKHKLGNRRCNLVLHQNDYQLLLVEAPDVPEEEVRSAIRWKIKDLIAIKLESAAIDIFFLPQDGNRSTKKMVYVVVSDTQKLKQLVDMVNGSGLKLAAIDIPEMAIRNIAQLKSAEQMSERGVAVARILPGGGTISLYRQGNLYLSRQFKLDYSGGLLDDLPTDTLALEIQRSLDYYERQMGLAPPALLYICGENISEDKITTDFTRSISTPTKHLTLHQELALGDETEESIIQLCVGALGGAFRESVATGV